MAHRGIRISPTHLATERPLHAVIVSIAKPVVVVLATSCASILAYVMTPLNEVVNAAIWKEKGEIKLISQTRNAKKGDVITVDVFIQPKSPVALSDGLLKIEYTNGMLRPGAETTPLMSSATPKITSTKKVFERTLEFIAEAPGKGEITAILVTKKITIRTTLPLQIAPASGSIYPTRLNFTGNWKVSIDGIHGQMQLKDVAATLNGEYRLSDGSGGQVEGTHDGKTFEVTLYRGLSPSRYMIEAEFDKNPMVDLEVHGSATLKIPTGDKDVPWRDDRKYAFYAIAQKSPN